MSETSVETLWAVLDGHDFNFESGMWYLGDVPAEELKLKVVENVAELSSGGQRAIREVILEGMSKCTCAADRTNLCLAMGALAIQGHQEIWEGSSVVGYVGKRMGLISPGFNFAVDNMREGAGKEQWLVDESRKCMLELLTILPEQVFNTDMKRVDSSARDGFRKRLMESFEDVLVAIEGCVDSLWGLGEALVPLASWWELGEWSHYLKNCSRVHFLIRAALQAMQESHTFAQELDKARPGKFRKWPSGHAGAGPSGNAGSTTVSSPTASSKGAVSSGWDIQSQRSLSIDGQNSASALYNSKHISRVQLPPGYPLGSLFGVKGANTRYIQSRCPGRVSFDVTKQEGMVLCKGQKDAVDVAKSILEQQFAYFKQSVGAYMSPAVFYFGFNTEVAIDGYTLNRFENDEVTRALERPGPFYCATPIAPDDLGTDVILSEAGSQHVLSGDNAATKTCVRSIYGAADIPVLLERFVTAIETIVPKAQKDDHFKVKVNFGKQLFLPATKHDQVPTEPMTMDGMNYCLQEKETIKGIFTNGVTTEVCENIQVMLEGMGFKQKCTKDTVSAHIRHPGSSAVYSLSFFRRNKGVLNARKVKYNSFKSQLLALMDPESIDFRMKLVGQRHINKGSSNQNAMCIERMAQSGAFSMKNSRLIIHRPRSGNRPHFVVDKCRSKKKTTYEGKYFWVSGGDQSSESAITIRVSITAVTTESQKTHNEVTGSCMEINDILSRCVPYRNPTKLKPMLKEIQHSLDGLAHFGKEVKQVAVV